MGLVKCTAWKLEGRYACIMLQDLTRNLGQSSEREIQHEGKKEITKKTPVFTKSQKRKNADLRGVLNSNREKKGTQGVSFFQDQKENSDGRLMVIGKKRKTRIAGNEFEGGQSTNMGKRGMEPA